MPMPIFTPDRYAVEGCVLEAAVRFFQREHHGERTFAGVRGVLAVLSRRVEEGGESIRPHAVDRALAVEHGLFSGVSVQRESFVKPAGSRPSDSAIASKPRMRQARKLKTRVAEGIFRASRSRDRRFNVFGDSFDSARVLLWRVRAAGVKKWIKDSSP